MIANIGFSALVTILLASVFSFSLVMYNIVALKKINEKTLSEIVFAIAFFSFVLAFISQICLIYSFIISDYSILNVYNNSHHLKPLIYKISGSWGNHEGSMILLITIICAYTFLYALIDNSEFKNVALAIQAFIIAGFSSYTAFVSNPFERLFPVPLSGLGLNPLLQDIGLALHPPMLYSGYIGFSLVFSIALAGLVKEKINSNLAINLSRWLNLSWALLTIGIALGSWWAYRELGWGGYWFWDAVENISLMPWIAAIALVHSVKILNKNGDFKLWTILLAIVTFILCLIGLFLVRSGLLTSLHSFAVDEKRGFYIIMLIALIGGFSLSIFSFKSIKMSGIKNISIDKGKEKNVFISKANLIIFNNYFLLIALFTIALGTLYPIISQVFYYKSISVGEQYYNKIFSILLLPFMIFLNLSYIKKYRDILEIKKLLSILLSIVLSFFIYFNYKTSFVGISLFFLSFTAFLFSSLSKFKPTNIGHSGFSLLLVGVILSTILGYSKEVSIKPGEQINISEDGSYKAIFKSVEYYAAKNFLSRKINFDIIKNDKIITTLSPELRYYPVSDNTTYEAAINHNLVSDIYFVVGNKDDNENYALRIYVKPFIYLIWIGCIFIAASAIISVIKLRRK